MDGEGMSSCWELGYIEGQQDAFSWLRGVPDDEHPMAPITDRACLAASIWSLGHNLAVAGALSAAAYLAYDAGWDDAGEGHNGEYTGPEFDRPQYLASRVECALGQGPSTPIDPTSPNQLRLFP